MEKKKAITLTLIGMFIFLFGVIGLTYAYWSRTLTQEDENLVYSDCLKLEVSWGSGGFTLDNAYPMTNEELVKDFFPSQEPYTFTITNNCSKEIPVSINMESLTADEPNLKDDYVDVILWSNEDTESKFEPETDEVLSHQGSRIEIGSEKETPSYKLIENKKNGSKLIADAKEAYQLYKFKLGANDTKSFNLLLFMDYDTPVDGTIVDGVPVQTNNANWAGKITLNNYEIPKAKIGGRDVELADNGNGLYAVEHTDANITDENGETESGWTQIEYRYAGMNFEDHDIYAFHSDIDNSITGYCHSLEECTNHYGYAISQNQGKCEVFRTAKDKNYVHNYVTFNNELWRIIGLVNVLVPQADGKEKVEQRLKIIKDQPFEEGMTWNSTYDNDWTQSSLMKYLNTDYYNGIISDGDSIKSRLTDQLSKNMIDTEISWNIGGSENDETSSNEFYERERGSIGGKGAPEKYEWNSNNTVEDTIYHSIGLIYPSDLGYATSGGTLGREKCYNSSGISSIECVVNDWIATKGVMWTITTDIEENGYAFYWTQSTFKMNYMFDAVNRCNYLVFPTLYLKKDVQIVNDDNDGSYEKPYQLKLES